MVTPYKHKVALYKVSSELNFLFMEWQLSNRYKLNNTGNIALRGDYKIY